ncbi:HlyD family secretion protein [Agrobacterium tumefaciens]|uniref:HlyD family secretion protein n=1 Tax=Agrobacterium tumefaciens TaxID=358 RepID=UPI00384FB081
MSQPASEFQQTEPTSSGGGARGAPNTDWTPPRIGFTGAIISIALMLTGMSAILKAWGLPPFSSAEQATEDAYVRGRTTVISPQSSGYVTKVLVKDYQLVKEGDILLQIDDALYQQQLQAAKAQVDVALASLDNNDQTVASRKADVQAASAQVRSAQAQLNRARADDRRARELSAQGAGPEAQAEIARAQLESAEAALLQANANVAIAQQAVKSAEVQGKVLAAQAEAARAVQSQAEISLSYTLIKAPESGRLSDIGVKLGQYVTSGSQLMFLVPQARWVIANYKERQTADMEVGQHALLTIDALNDQKFTGKVDEISPATGAEFSILRPDNATGNFTKVPQRIPVRITLDQMQPGFDRLRPGMSVEVYVDTSSASD